MPPQTRYARSGNVNIAYQIAGAGTVDLLMIPGWVTHLALDWHEPRWVRWFERMTAFARIIRFDKRGTGMSDRPLGIPTADERMADALAVMDAVGVARAHVLGWSEGGPLGVMVAATYPERVKSLTLYGTQATFRRRHDYPFGDEESEAFYGELERDWGSEVFAREFIPDADPAAVRRLAAYYQAGASPSAAVALARANAAMDVRGLLASVRVPTLVANRQHDPVAPGETGKYLAERIPGSRFIQLPGSAHAPWLGDAERICTEVEHFVTGVRPVEREPGAVRTILHCDIVGSTARAVSLGDERWSELLAEYDASAELAVGAHAGRIVDRTGDGFMAGSWAPSARSAPRGDSGKTRRNSTFRYVPVCTLVRCVRREGFCAGSQFTSPRASCRRHRVAKFSSPKPCEMSWRGRTSASVIAGPASSRG